MCVLSEIGIVSSQNRRTLRNCGVLILRVLCEGWVPAKAIQLKYIRGDAFVRSHQIWSLDTGSDCFFCSTIDCAWSNYELMVEKFGNGQEKSDRERKYAGNRILLSRSCLATFHGRCVFRERIASRVCCIDFKWKSSSSSMLVTL